MLIAKGLLVRMQLVRASTLGRRAIVLLAAGVTLATLGWMTGSECAEAQTSNSTSTVPATTTTQPDAQPSAKARALAIAQAQAAAQAAAAAQAKSKKGKRVKQAAAAKPVTPAIQQANPLTPKTPVRQAPPATPVTRVKQSKQNKNIYTGPDTVEVLPPKPMLNEEGKQRVDPDGNLMFYPVVQQIRDKKGHPVFDRAGNAVFQTANYMGYDEHGKKIEVKKEKQPRMTPVSIRSGTLTVDGWTNKARINFNIPDLKYIYVYVPGIGTTIVSPGPFPGATEQAGAFKDNILRVTVEGHLIELTSERELLGSRSQNAWVAVDREFVLPTKYPTIGYGMTMQAPYVWPGSKQEGVEAGVNMKKAPALPLDMLAAPLSPCPTGMIRKIGPPAQPGQIEAEQPCVTIQARPVSTNAANATPSNAETLATTPTRPAQ
jgi:hypothetical protein